MPDFNVIIENKNVLDKDRAKKVSVTIRGVTFKCDLPSSYGQASTARLSECALGAWGAGLVWLQSAGHYGPGDVAVSAQTSYGVLTGTNALPSPATLTTMKIEIDHTATLPVVVTFA